MIYISHAANVIVLIGVCTALLRNSADMDTAFGPDTAARRILICIYGTILLTSLYALVMALVSAPHVSLSVGFVLFPLQIIYKVATAFLVGVHNPVVRANLGIAALHSVTLIAVLMPF